MSPAAAYSDPAPTLTAQRGGQARPTQPMSFYDLQNHFWQLDASERFSGTETRLYFYWLNRFNAEFWPADITRWGKQVEADLGLTDKPLAAARKALVARGLLTYREGTRTRAAVWGLTGVYPDEMSRTNSGPSAIIRTNSGQSTSITPTESRNNSGPPADIIRNNSGLYKEKTLPPRTEDQDYPDGAADAAALPEKKIEPAEVLTAQPIAAHTEGAADVPTSVITRRRLLLRESPVATLPAFVAYWQAAAEAKPDTYAPYACADLAHYHEALLGWSNAEGKTKFDWLSTILGSMRRDAEAGRLRKASALPLGTSTSSPVLQRLAVAEAAFALNEYDAHGNRIN